MSYELPDNKPILLLTSADLPVKISFLRLFELSPNKYTALEDIVKYVEARILKNSPNCSAIVGVPLKNSEQYLFKGIEKGVDHAG